MGLLKPTLVWQNLYPERGGVIWSGNCGTVRVFGIAYIQNYGPKRDSEEPKYELKCYLPGVTKDLGYSEGAIDELKKIAQDRFETWLNATGLMKR